MLMAKVKPIIQRRIQQNVEWGLAEVVFEENSELGDFVLERCLLDIKGEHASNLQLREYKDAEIPLYTVK